MTTITKAISPALGMATEEESLVVPDAGNPVAVVVMVEGDVEKGVDAPGDPTVDVAFGTEPSAVVGEAPAPDGPVVAAGFAAEFEPEFELGSEPVFDPVFEPLLLPVLDPVFEPLFEGVFEPLPAPVFEPVFELLVGAAVGAAELDVGDPPDEFPDEAPGSACLKVEMPLAQEADL
ncbi:hypothetical protein HDV00_011015 [Rhizophlyctis rosea]|nr:hypothetical protein HDV00_011015 [Rhizophlyctis rosea]